MGSIKVDKKNLLLKGIENGSFPEVLYKYRTVDQARKALENFSFWFASPSSFNDPFDCSLSEKKSPDLNDVKKHLENLGQQKGVIDIAIELFKKDPSTVDGILCRIKKVIDSYGVFALSERFDNILMWSHYSDSHKGIVFGFELKSDLGFFVTPIKVDYRDQYDELNYFKNPNKSAIDTIKIKSSQWEYEKEIRIYKSKFGLYEINKEAIKEVYFGINSSQEDIYEIIGIFESKGLHNVSFYKGEKKHGSFGIDFHIIKINN
ncbi:Protein of unknown function [Marinomonas polaris DSM 16579]|uniref:DUF2971 domain-containing protein n=1 Tax=Marinomonas polaris DSM 16579 TaxID=1122206 RepID=A0A1M5CP69_9GAMM|nr:DUF2971 domain-containing protein [Marinomonas polaris]SHF56466.1 Protein of unknown function [Marinomonas polaris DSM 16579]